MKTINLILICIVLSFVCIHCKKDDNNTNLSFTTGGKYISKDKTVNPGDTLIFQWNIESTDVMKTFSITNNGTELTDWSSITLPGSQKNRYTDCDTIIASTTPGTYTFTFSVKNAAGDRLASKYISIIVASDFNYFVNKKLYVPNSAMSSPVFISTITGKTYSYNEISTETSTLIDLGYYYNATTKKHILFAPIVNPISYYDLSTWTKSATILKINTSKTVTFAGINSEAAIKAACTSLGTSNTAEGIAAGNFIYFKTAAGKLGLINIKGLKIDSNVDSTYVLLEIKTQK